MSLDLRITGVVDVSSSGGVALPSDEDSMTPKEYGFSREEAALIFREASS